MNRQDIKTQIHALEARLNLTFPRLYLDFLGGIDDGEVVEVNASGLCFYAYSDLEERNQTYAIQEDEPQYFMIGQDGDIGYFIKTDTPDNEAIFSNDLGALGSLEMIKEAEDIFAFLEKRESYEPDC